MKLSGVFQTQASNRAFSTKLIIAALVWGGLFAVSEGVLSPHVKAATSLEFQLLGFAAALFGLSLWLAFIVAIICLVSRKWGRASSWFVTWCILYVSYWGSLALKGDRFVFTAEPHRQIAEIYHRNPSRFFTDQGTVRPIPLREECGPPNGCECWLVIDPHNVSGVDAEIGGWHGPKAKLFPKNTLPGQFAIVDVRRIDSSAYSVLGCEVDWTAWKPA